MALGRVTVVEFEAALATTHYLPSRGVTLDTAKQRGCPIGLVALATGKLTRPGVTDLCSAALALGLDHGYATAFVGGFSAPVGLEIQEGAAARIGYLDGRACAVHLEEAGRAADAACRGERPRSRRRDRG